MDIAIDRVHEVVDAPPAPAPAVEQLDLQAPEEALAGAVVRGAALLRHRPRDAVLLAPLVPARPTVMASAVSVPDRVLALRQRRGGCIEHGVRELRVRRGRHGPADDHSVEAVHDGAEIDLAGGYPELGDVGEPQRVGRIGVEVALHQVLRGVGYLAFVGAVLPFLAALGDQVELAHRPCDDLLRDPHALAPQVQADSAIAVAAVAGGEDLGYAPPQPRMLVRPSHRLDLVLVAASAHVELG